MEIGELVFDKDTGAQVRVLERTEVWDYVTYRVFDGAKGTVYRVPETQLACEQVGPVCDENYLRYILLLAQLKNELAGGTLTSLASDILPLPHQLHVLRRVLSGSQIRYLLADEVGLGKTIEAGLVLRELKARGLVRRILVVCPMGLVNQWEAEMQEKFHERFRVILPKDFDAIRRLMDSSDIYGQFDQVITPMDSIKPIEKHAGWTPERVAEYNQSRAYAVAGGGWDLIIVDEAHRMAGSSIGVARHKLGEMLAAASPYLLLLTATPHSGKTKPFLRLMRLLDKQVFPNSVRAIVKDQVAPYLIRTEKREAIDNQGEHLFKQRFTHLVTLQWEEKHSLQRDLYEKITAYVGRSWLTAQKKRKKDMCLIFLLIIMQRMAASSTAAVRQGMLRRQEALGGGLPRVSELSEDELWELGLTDDVEDIFLAAPEAARGELKELETLLTLSEQAEHQYQDVKAVRLLDLVDELLSAEPGQKLIIFTEFVDTQKYLDGLLAGKGYQTVCLNGHMDMEERQEALQRFRSEASIFISTDAGGEGLNLQFANIIINYDLPWNPMKIEQRCGRVDRIGQQRDVHVYNFIIEDTIEHRVREVLEAKLSTILKELGVDKFADVLDSETVESDFTELYMSSLLRPQTIADRAEPLSRDIREQVEDASHYRDVIHEEKDLQQLVGQEMEFDVKAALRQIKGYYCAWQGEELPTLLDKLSLDDDFFRQQLRREISQDRQGKLLSAAIEDFPNEAGYFMLWEISVAGADAPRRILPVFVNQQMLLRPVAGQRLFEALRDERRQLTVHLVDNLDREIYAELTELATEFAQDDFVKLRDKYLQQNEDNYKRKRYALQLRKEAAERQGIANIKKARLAEVSKEELEIEREHEKGRRLCPVFRLMFLMKLEA